MPKGVPHRDRRLDNAIELYLRIWPEDGREHATRMVQIGVMTYGVKGLTAQLQKQVGAMGREDAKEDVS